MKDDEKLFFSICFMMRHSEVCSVRDVVNLFEGVIHHKRCWYLLEKWSRLGFYDFGVTLDLGWFNPDKIPERYIERLREIILNKERFNASSESIISD